MHAEQEGAPRRRLSPLALIIAAAVIAVDQITKVLVLDHLGPGPHHVIGPFGLMLTSNTGSAFSLFQGSTGVLAVVDVVVVGLLAVVAVRARTLPLRVGLGLMLGGAIGNLVDRVVHHSKDGGVIDFITFPHFATFNAAVAAITIGVIVVLGALILDLMADRRTKGASSV